jgi:hypothetical protein
MTDCRRATVNRRIVGLALFGMLAFAACGTSAGSTAPAATPPPSTTPAASSASSAPASPAAGGGSTTSQTDTDWGRIWDSLPAGFPTIAGSTPSEEAAAGPATAVLVVNGGAAQAIATSLQTSLEAAGYTTIGLGGPLEDGTYTLDMTGPPTGCMLQVTATPTGGLTTVTILYGAACPHG